MDFKLTPTFSGLVFAEGLDAVNCEIAEPEFKANSYPFRNYIMQDCPFKPFEYG